MPGPVAYEVRVQGRVGPAARAAFGELAVEVREPATVLSGAFDQAELQELLTRIRAFGFELIDVRRHRSSS